MRIVTMALALVLLGSLAASASPPLVDVLVTNPTESAWDGSFGVNGQMILLAETPNGAHVWGWTFVDLFVTPGRCPECGDVVAVTLDDYWVYRG